MPLPAACTRTGSEGLQGKKAGLCQQKPQIVAPKRPLGHQAVLAFLILRLDGARHLSSEYFPSFLDRC